MLALRPWVLIGLVLASLIGGCASDALNPAPLAEPLRSLGVDSRSSVETRIGDVPTEVVKRAAQFRGVSLTSHTPSATERRKFSAALAALSPLQRRVVQEHLRSVSFADGLGANAQTVRVDCKDPCVAFDLIINTQILNETVSEFLTRKERSLFETDGSSLNVSVDGGSMDAVVFILLHESTHMIDGLLKLTPQYAPGFPIPASGQTAFSRDVWDTVTTPAAPYRSAVLDSVQPGGKPIAIGQAQAVYDDLRKTPFVSVYARSMAPEDLAELAAWRQMTQKLGQPYRIEIREGARVVFVFEPMKSALVRNRLPHLARLDAPDLE